MRSALIVSVPWVMTTLPLSVPIRFSKSTSAGCSAEKLIGFSLSAFSARAPGAAPSSRHPAITTARPQTFKRLGISLLDRLRLKGPGNARTELRGLALVVELEPDALDYSTRLADRHGSIRFGALRFWDDMQIVGFECDRAGGVMVLHGGPAFGL